MIGRLVQAVLFGVALRHMLRRVEQLVDEVAIVDSHVGELLELAKAREAARLTVQDRKRLR